MFGGNQQEMLQKMQEAMEQSKLRLENSKVYGEAGGGLIRIELNGNRKLQSLEINAPLAQIEKEDLEDLLTVALQRALEEAEKVNEKEMSSSAMNFIPKF
jgi:nucleoid-associated protein EbfC